MAKVFPSIIVAVLFLVGPLAVAQTNIVGKGRVCLSDEVKLPRGKSIEIPATTIFQDGGLISGKATFPKNWKVVQQAELFGVNIFLREAILLTADRPCADASFAMYIERPDSPTKVSGTESRVFRISDVLDYPLPSQKPFIEMADLIGDGNVHAILFTDVSGGRHGIIVKEEVQASECLKEATKVAVHLGTELGRQTSSIVELGDIGDLKGAYSCPRRGLRDVDLTFTWSGAPRPSARAKTAIVEGGAFLTGAAKTEIADELDRCLSEALKPAAREIARRDFRGTAIECQSFRRDGGGGSATIYRAYGALPIHPEPSPAQLSALRKSSDLLRAKTEASEREALEDWLRWQNLPVPDKVKAFILRTSRMIVLSTLCPSVKLNLKSIESGALWAGISLKDVGEGGKYNALLKAMTIAMSKSSNETETEACAAAQKYK